MTTKRLRFTGQVALCFQEIGELIPGEEREFVAHVADRLLARADFELVKVAKAVKKLPAKASASKLETETDSSALPSATDI